MQWSLPCSVTGQIKNKVNNPIIKLFDSDKTILFSFRCRGSFIPFKGSIVYGSSSKQSRRFRLFVVEIPDFPECDSEQSLFATAVGSIYMHMLTFGYRFGRVPFLLLLLREMDVKFDMQIELERNTD